MNYKYSDLFLQDSVKKELYITYDGGEITNTELHSNQFELTESICSDGELRFGGCEASVLKFRVSYIYQTLKDKELNVSMVLDGNSDEPFVFGKYKVYSDTPTSDRNFRDILAYDKMYDIVNSDVAEWYNGLEFPISMKDFRTSFVANFNIEQVDIDLPNDNMVIERTVEVAELSGGDVARSICEINGCFGHINRENKFDYVILSIIEELYPSNNLFPANNVYPLDFGDSTTISKSHYISCQYEDYKTSWIDAIEIRSEEESAGAIVGNSTDNVYVIYENFLLYGKSTSQLESIASNLLSSAKKIQYRPCNIVAIGNPSISVGDGIRLNTKYGIVNTYVLQRTLRGIQSLRDNYIAEGTEKYESSINSFKNDTIKLKSKVNVLSRTIEGNRLYVEDLEEDLRTEIEQTAGSISTKVSKGNVSSEISQESDQVTIKGNRLIVESDNFKVDKNGKVEIGLFARIDQGIEFRTNYVNSPTDPSPSWIKFAYGHIYGIAAGWGPSFHVNNSDGTFDIIANLRDITYADGPWVFKKDVDISGKFTCSGGKSRVATTENYGKRLLYCYEMPSPMFGDIGEGQIDETGKCYVYIDDMFEETIDTECKYQVFLQAYGSGNCYVSERTPTYFVIEGTENLKFGWEIKAVQKDYDTTRLEMHEVDTYTDIANETSAYMNRVIEESGSNVSNETFNYLEELLYSPEREVI